MHLIFLIPLAAVAFAASSPARSASLDAAAQAVAEPAASPAPQADGAMQERVKVALMSDPALRGARIAISTRDGQVTLAGVVISEEQRQRAQQVVAAVDGVRRVDNVLEVQPLD